MGKRKSEEMCDNRKKCRRRRFISSSSSEDETNDPATNDRHSSLTPPDVSATRAQPTSTLSAPVPDEPVASTSATEAVLPELQLDDEILQLLGDAPKTDVDLGPAIHKDIADRWREILSKGLSKEIKEKLFKEHLIPANCDLLIPPLLNPEVKAALPDALIKRDNILVDRQKQIGIALAALSEAMKLLITKGEHSKVLKAVSDACRILCDTHFNETKTRRSFAISATNANLKDTLIEAKRDKYLFGDNMSDKLKSAKNIQKSGADLKQNQKNTKFHKSNFYKNKSLNIRALQRKTSGKPDAGRRRNVPTGVQTRATTARTMTSSTRSRSPPPPPSRRPYRRT